MNEYRVKRINKTWPRTSAQVIRISDGKEMLKMEQWVAQAKRACDFLNGKPNAENMNWLIIKE